MLISKVTTFKNLLQVLCNIIPKVIFKCSTEGIKIYAMESSKVALVEVILNRKWFNTYHCRRLLKIGVNIIELYDKIQNASEDTNIVLSYNIISNQKLIVSIVNSGNIYDSFINLINF